jgi:hypothetical protein
VGGSPAALGQVARETRDFFVWLVIRSVANTTSNYEESSSRRFLSHRALAALRAISSQCSELPSGKE